jgi:hypothetical protein
MKKSLVAVIFFAAPLYAQNPTLDLHVASEYLAGPQNSINDTGKGSKDTESAGFTLSLPVWDQVSFELGADKVTEVDNFKTDGFNGPEHAHLHGYKIQFGIKIDLK